MKTEIETKFKRTDIGKIPEDWEIRQLKEVAIVNEHTIGKDYNHSEIEYVDIDSVENGTITKTQVIPVKEAPSRAKRIVREDDIIISTVRPNLRHFAFVKNPKSNTVVSTGFAVVSCKSINSRFLYYYLTTDRYTNHLAAIADSHTSVYPSFNPDILENSFVPYPAEWEQAGIAKILTALDDKVELNQQMNKTLEAIAKAIFKHWFVDFEFPNEEGKPYKSSGGEIVYSEELRKETPKGWSLVDLPDAASVVDCLHSKKPEPKEDGPILLQFYNLSPEHSVDLSDTYHVSEEDYKNWTRNILVREGDLLFTNVGRQAIARVPYWFEGGIGRNITAVRPEGIDSVYLFHYFLSAHGTRQIGSNIDDGTIMSSLNVKGIRKLKVLVLPQELQDRFSSVAAKMQSRVETDLITSKNLSQIRDSLLPKLMSGRIRVPVEVR